MTKAAQTLTTTRSHDQLDDADMFLMYKAYIEYMRHENDLVHQRTTWLVTLQAGLVVVLSYLTQKYFDFFIAVVKKSPTDFLTLSDLHLSSTAFLVFWAIVCIVGIVSSIFAWISIKAAVRAQYQVNERWKCKFQTRAQWMGFPDLSGGGSDRASHDGWAFATFLPFFLVIMWILFLCLDIIFWRSLWSI
jgi:hypothetical protein